MEAVMLLVGLAIGAGAVWFAERYHERRTAQLLNLIGQLQVQVDSLHREVARLKEPPIPQEEL